MHWNNEIRIWVGPRFIAPARLPHSWGQVARGYLDLFVQQLYGVPTLKDLSDITLAMMRQNHRPA